MWPGFRARLSSRAWNVSSKAFTCDVKLEWDSVQVSSCLSVWDTLPGTLQRDCHYCCPAILDFSFVCIVLLNAVPLESHPPQGSLVHTLNGKHTGLSAAGDMNESLLKSEIAGSWPAAVPLDAHWIV